MAVNLRLSVLDHRLASDPGLQSIVNLAAAARTSPAAASAYPFRFWQVETLLDQSADLLERAIRDRAAYDSLRAQLLRIQLEVTEFDQLNTIHDDEVSAGWYVLERDQSVPEQSAEQKVADSNRAAAAVYQKFLTSELADVNVTRLASEAGLLAKANSYTTYAGQHSAGVSPRKPHPVNSVYHLRSRL